MSPSTERIDEVATYHELFYRMALASGPRDHSLVVAGRVSPGREQRLWNHPSGRRLRPAAELILRYGPQLKSERPWPATTTWFDMDRDAHAGGYWFVCFNSGRDAYRQAEASGQQLEFVLPERVRRRPRHHMWRSAIGRPQAATH